MTNTSVGRTELLQHDIQAELAVIAPQRRRNKRLAFFLRLSATFASAITTVSLGLKVGGTFGQMLTHVALILSATATVMMAIDAYFDPRSQWILEVTHWARLQALQRKLNDELARSDGSLANATVDELRTEFEQLMTTHLDAWQDLRTRPGTPP
ncbi:SLATT domain-containing protein [Nonomuraea sp. NPDC050451]|uniref:SLATT domain-containing protein n=1 Tax=Nonomuraea sp. NPDC050451 TaxID=3364364 RepID=UPI0037B84C37